MKEHYKTICTKLDSGQNLKLIGCKHGDWWNKSDFHLRKEEYIQSLNGADILVLEQPFLAEFYEEPFFKMISQIAYNKNMSICTIDPLNQNTDSLNDKFYEKYIESKKFCMAFEEGNGNLISMCECHEKHRDPFDVIKYANTLSDFWFKISFGEFDWRNIRIAKGLDEEISKLDVENILAIHGGFHTRPIHFYLKNPKFRETKLRRKYSEFEMLGEKGIKLYAPAKCENKQEQAWKRIK